MPLGVPISSLIIFRALTKYSSATVKLNVTAKWYVKILICFPLEGVLGNV